MKTKELSHEEIDALIERLKEADEHGLAIEKEDLQLIIKILLSFTHDQTVSNHRLKKLAGLVSKSEQLKDLLPGSVSRNRNRQSREKKEKVEPKLISHEHQELKKGDDCPDCQLGKLKKDPPAILIRIRGELPLQSEKHLREKFRCNACGEYYTADLPEEVKKDGKDGQMYGYSARAVLAINRYFAGLPLYRQENIAEIFGENISASTIYDQVSKVAESLRPVWLKLIDLAGKEGNLFQFDDTRNKILDSKPELRPNRRTKKLKERKGIFTSGMYVETKFGKKIILYRTNIGHSGEWLDEVLQTRANDSPPPLLMSDAATWNRPSVIENYHSTLCNAHARREFAELIDVYPDQVNWVLDKYALIWQNNTEVKNLNSKERLKFHKDNSLPVMEEIKFWCEDLLASEDFESNSSLGKAVRYFLKNYDALIGFCQYEEALIDNNRMEALLKMVIRGRKNSYFFKTQNGADVADIITSVINTCHQDHKQVFDYFVELQRNSELVKSSPEDWLPWSYKTTLKALNS